MITITVRINNQQMDLMVLPDQRMSEVLKVLKENRKIFFQIEKINIYSIRKKEFINQQLTFRQAAIYSGDILELR